MVLRQLDFKQRAEVSAVDVRGWADVDLDDVVWPSDIGTWIYVGVAVGVILVGISVFGYCMCRKHSRGSANIAQRSREPPATIKFEYGLVPARDELQMVVLQPEDPLPDQYPAPIPHFASRRGQDEKTSFLNSTAALSYVMSIIEWMCEWIVHKTDEYVASKLWA